MKQEPGMAARTTWSERSSSTQDQLCTAKRANGPDSGFVIPCVGCGVARHPWWAIAHLNGLAALIESRMSGPPPESCLA